MADFTLFDAVSDLCTEIMAKQRSTRRNKKATTYAPQSTTASSLGYTCDRRLVYVRTHPHYASPPGEELSSIFEEGDIHQEQVRRELSELGHEVLEAERSYRDKTIGVGGRIDGKLVVVALGGKRIVLEIKTCTGKPPLTMVGLLAAGGRLARYVRQIQSYMLLDGVEAGAFLFKDKITGLWWMVPIPLDLEIGEEVLARADRVNAHVAADTLPDRIADRSECDGCPFRSTICLPDDAPADPMQLVNDAELVAELAELQNLEAAAKRHKQLDAKINQRFKLTKGDRFVAGDGEWLVTKKPHGKGTRIKIARI